MPPAPQGKVESDEQPQEGTLQLRQTAGPEAGRGVIPFPFLPSLGLHLICLPLPPLLCDSGVSRAQETQSQGEPEAQPAAIRAAECDYCTS